MAILGTRMEDIVDILRWAHDDPGLWAQIKDLEREETQRYHEADRMRLDRPFGPDADEALGPPKHPPPSRQLLALVKRRHGNQKFDDFLLTLALKRLARDERWIATDFRVAPRPEDPD
jgi:hypothetical protein